MTERIDLDELDVGSVEADDDGPNRGDWFWRGAGDPEEEPGATDAWTSGPAAAAGERPDAGGSGGGSATDNTDGAPDGDGRSPGDRESGSPEDGDGGEGGSPERDDDGEPERQPVPRVPRETDGAPVGIPVVRGGAGGGEPAATGGAPASGGGGQGGGEVAGDAETPAGDEGTTAGHAAADADDMTLAFTYGAIQRLADPRAAVAEAEGWTDWIGIVGDVGPQVINKFQRDHAVDVDFFNGAGTGPGERLAGIDARSMFYADRMVVVGREGEDEGVAERAGWEFVPLREAAENAGWTLEDG